MSNVIEDGIIKLGYEGEKFASGVKSALGYLGQLKDGIKNSISSINNFKDEMRVGKAFETMSSNIEQISDGFTTMGIISTEVLNNLVDSAMNAGKKIADALVIEPVKSGFSEYETQINAVQTILANTESKGTTIDDVNKALDELNLYADKTIYNFTEMTRNIGTFTAAGVDLDTSVQAIKGIANLAAVSGSNSEQASRAMYQLSQALSTGTLKLQDWNSVVNAGMGGQVFQDALKETARVHGIAIDDMIKKEGSFRETLSSGWITSDILTETLAKFTGDLTAEQLKAIGYSDEQIEKIIKMGQTANDAATKVKTFTQLFDTLKEAMQSGWTQSWELLIGDFEEAKEFLTEISDTLSEIINASSDKRNALLEGWKQLGGRDSLIESARNIMQGMIKIGSRLKETFSSIFPPVTADTLYKITKRVEELTGIFKKFSEVKFTFLTEIFKIIKSAIGTVSKITKELIKASPSIQRVTDSVKDLIKTLSEKATTTLKKIPALFSSATSSAVAYSKDLKEKLKATPHN